MPRRTTGPHPCCQAKSNLAKLALAKTLIAKIPARRRVRLLHSTAFSVCIHPPHLLTSRVPCRDEAEMPLFNGIKVRCLFVDDDSGQREWCDGVIR